MTSPHTVNGSIKEDFSRAGYPSKLDYQVKLHIIGSVCFGKPGKQRRREILEEENLARGSRTGAVAGDNEKLSGKVGSRTELFRCSLVHNCREEVRSLQGPLLKKEGT